MSDSDKIQIPEAAKDIGMAIGSVLLVFLLTFAYSGNWPPMVVIESGSMEHTDNPLYDEPGFTHIGTIDTGDLVVVKEARKSEIVTYLQGKKTWQDHDIQKYFLDKKGVIWDRTYGSENISKDTCSSLEKVNKLACLVKGFKVAKTLLGQSSLLVSVPLVEKVRELPD